MFNAIGVQDFAVIEATTAATDALQQSMAANTHITASAGAALLPAGMEAASALATGTQKTYTADFAAKMFDAVSQLAERNVITRAHSATTLANDAVHAANVAAANVESFAFGGL